MMTLMVTLLRRLKMTALFVYHGYDDDDYYDDDEYYENHNDTGGDPYALCFDIPDADIYC